MVDQMRDRETNILTQRETMLRVFNQIEPVFIVAENDPAQILYANKLAKLRFHFEDDSPVKTELLHSFRTQCQPQASEQIFDTDSGRWYMVSCERFFWDQGLDSRLYHCVDITAHIKRENDLEQEAHTDKLTGLNNRYAFERAFDKLWDMCRQNRSPLSAIIFDIDFFKKVNDTYGHLQGDRCLIEFAGVLRSCIGRFNDVIARFGGEEFLALLPFTNEEAAVKIAESVRIETESMEIPLISKEGTPEYISITISGGVASRTPTFEAIPEELVEDADKALYNAKQTGRNRICVSGQVIMNKGGRGDDESIDSGSRLRDPDVSAEPESP
jgi:diguanylate cyclase (GGDEF)-like protein